MMTETRCISVTWVVSGNTASLDAERGRMSPKTSPPFSRNISEMCSSRTPSASPWMKNIGAWVALSFHAAAPVSPADRQQIAALDEHSALHAWDEVVGQPVPATVVVKHGWICDPSVPFVWQDAWNDRDDGWAGRVLRPALGWPDDEEVLFVERPRRALKTQFDVFLRAWRAFLFEDEGPLLVS